VKEQTLKRGRKEEKHRKRHLREAKGYLKKKRAKGKSFRQRKTGGGNEKKFWKFRLWVSFGGARPVKRGPSARLVAREPPVAQSRREKKGCRFNKWGREDEERNGSGCRLARWRRIGGLGGKEGGWRGGGKG